MKEFALGFVLCFALLFAFLFVFFRKRTSARIKLTNIYSIILIKKSVHLKKNEQAFEMSEMKETKNVYICVRTTRFGIGERYCLWRAVQKCVDRKINTALTFPKAYQKLSGLWLNENAKQMKETHKNYCHRSSHFISVYVFVYIWKCTLHCTHMLSSLYVLYVYLSKT